MKSNIYVQQDSKLDLTKYLLSLHIPFKLEEKHQGPEVEHALLPDDLLDY